LGDSFKGNLIKILKQLRQSRMALVMNSTIELPPSDLLDLLIKLDALKASFKDYWLSMNFDALLTPAGVLPAVPHRFNSELPFLTAHFQPFSLLDFPSGVLPVRFVQSDDLRDLHQVHHHRSTSNLERPQDRMHEYFRLAQMDSEGLPCGIQVVTLPNQDERCLWLMEQIERIIDFNDVEMI
jgi:fatty acid amide hydrolase